MASDADNTSSKNAVWLRLFTAEFLVQVTDLTDRQRGMLITFMAFMHQRRGPIENDPRRLAKRCNSSSRSFSDDLKALLSSGLVYLTDGGLWSPLVDKELQHFAQKSQKARTSAAQRYKKNEKNQRSGSANARDTEADSDSEIDSDALSEHQKSHPDSNDFREGTKNAGKSSARGRATPPIYDVNEKVDIPGLGECFVDKIVSIRPLNFVVFSRDDEGEHHAYRVNQDLEYFEIDIKEAEDLPDLSRELENDATA